MIVKSRQETCSRDIEKNIAKNILGIYKNEGFKAMFTGVGSTLMRNAP